MKKAFVKTENYARFAAGVKAVEQRGAAEAGMMLVHGQPGYGKSHIVSRGHDAQVFFDRAVPGAEHRLSRDGPAAF